MSSWLHWAILSALLFVARAEFNESRCERTPLQVISVFDITIANIGQFRELQNRLIDTLIHVDKETKGRQINYGLIVYHRLPVLLTPLSVKTSGNLDKIIKQIETLNPRYHQEKSSVQALQTAYNQISLNGQPGVKSLIFLTHSDGLTSDSLPEILDIKLKLSAVNASIFVFSNGQPAPTLLHYTKSKDRLYSRPADLNVFYNTIDSTVGACSDDITNSVSPHKTFGVRNSNLQPTAECPSNQVDLMIVLDTSGSVQRTFEREQNLAIDLVNSLDKQLFDASLKVSVIQFSAEPMLTIGLRQHASKQTILDRLRAIRFTGRSTRIVNAINFGLREMSENNRKATKIFVLISDGNSLDYWHDVKKAGESLRQSGANVFVASTSSEINFDEMLIYAGNNRNIFIGTRDKIFPIAVSALIQKCLSVEQKRITDTTETKTISNDQFLLPQRTQINRKEEPITGTVPNEARPPAHPEPFFTRVKGPKEETPSQLKKQFDDQSANSRNLFNELSTDEIIANSTEIDENEFEGSGQEVKIDESVVKLISTVSQQQSNNESTQNCIFDLVFVIEGTETEEPLGVARKIIDRIPLVPDQVKPLLVLNGKISNFNGHNKIAFFEVLQNSKTREIQTNPAQLTEVIRENRRPNSQLLLLILSPNEIQNGSIDQLTQQLSPQHTFVLSKHGSPTNNASSLIRSFNDTQEFNQQTIDLLLPCISASVVEQKFNEFVNAGRNAQKAQPVVGDCENDSIEVFIVLSGAQLDEESLGAKIPLLNSLPVFDQPKRIRVSVTVYTNEAKLLVPLGSFRQKSDNIQRVIEHLEQIEISTSNFSLVAGLKLALADILPSKRPKARLIGLLIVDETPVDSADAILDIYQTLNGTQADVNLLVLNNDWDRNLTLQYVSGNASKVYTQPKKFVEAATTQLFNCQNDTQDSAKSEDSDVFDVKNSELFRRSSNAIQQEEISNSTSECKEVDLIIVVDTSTSVEEEFNKQLQFSLDLVKHLPEQELENGQIQIGITSFYVQAREELPLGKLRQKSDILDKISSIQHTGGSTFIANGLKLAIEMARNRTRPNARLAIVLISDGNSQDEWITVLSTAAQLRLLNAEILAITASHDFFFRELEIYADKNVFTDSQFSEFLAKLDSSILTGCFGSAPVLKKAREQVTKISTTTILPTLPTTQFTNVAAEVCDMETDLMFVLDTSTPSSQLFYSQRKLVQELAKILPLNEQHIRVALVRFNSTATLQFGFSSNQSQSEISRQIQQITYTGGNTSLVAGVESALVEIETRSRRPNSRLVILLVSAGNSRDGWTQIQSTSKKLRQLNNTQVYALTLSNAYYFDELREYTNNEKNIYADERVDNFIQDIGQQILSCESNESKTETVKTDIELSQNKDPKTEFAARDEEPVVKNETPADKADGCNFAKIDLILILDASTSRESVFEHQRELALSLIERLPISRGDAHVSIGLNSFVHVPTMRLTLGLGRDRNMVRKAIEEIEFKGGSTLTSQAIELAIKDLEKGRRRDAVQVIVLFNDGMSQDEWHTVEETSQHLASANAELFGVALGGNVDLRELQLYIKRKERIYRDGAAETERFLQDVVALLRNDTSGDCPLFFNDPEEEPTLVELPHNQKEQLCEKPKLDIVALFDTSDNTANMSDPKLNSNRYLLLDVLGSLPLGSQVHVAVFSFGQTAQLEFDLTGEEEKEVLVEKVEAIQPRKGRPSYANAVTDALEYYKRNHRSDARGLLLIVGDGKNTTDGMEERSLAANQIRRTNNLLCQAVSSSKDVELQTLIAYTGSIGNVFNYDRNAEFAKQVFQLSTATNNECKQPTPINQKSIELKDIKDAQPLLQDIASPIAEASDKNLFASGSEKLLKKTTIKSTTTSKPTDQTTKILPQTTISTTLAKKQEKTPKIEKPAKLNVELDATTVEAELEKSTKGTTIEAIFNSTKNQPSTLKIQSSTVKVSSTDSTTTKSSTTARPLTTTPKPKPAVKLTNITTNCQIDLMFIIDTSGSVNETLEHTKQIAKSIVDEFNVAPNNTHVSIVKFASKARVLHAFGDSQEKKTILQKLDNIFLTVGSTTAIHTALLQAISEFTSIRGARLNKAQSLAVIFTDGFAQKDMSVEAELLREIASVYAVGINHDYPISRTGLEELTGDSKRVFTDANIGDFYSLLKQNFAKNCKNL